MTAFCPRRSRRHHERGAVLIVLLVLLLIVTMLGVSLMRLQTTEQRMMVNSANHSVAAQNAEATLRWAECSLQGGCAGASWTSGTYLQNAAGLYSLNTTTGSTVTATTPSSTTTGATWTAPAGTTLAYAGATLQSANTPQYVIEKLPPVMMPGDSISQEQYNGGGGASPYQVTAYAQGADASSQTVLQSTFRP